jgi:acyl carrier protein
MDAYNLLTMVESNVINYIPRVSRYYVCLCPLYLIVISLEKSEEMITENSLTVEETLRKLVARVVHNQDVVLNPAGTFRELGADSIDVVQIMVSIEDALDIDLEDQDLKTITNIGDFTDYLKKKVAEKSANN